MAKNGEITDGEVIIPDGQNIIGTNTLKSKIRIKPLGKLTYLETELSYTKTIEHGVASA